MLKNREKKNITFKILSCYKVYDLVRCAGVQVQEELREIEDPSLLVKGVGEIFTEETGHQQVNHELSKVLKTGSTLSRFS